MGRGSVEAAGAGSRAALFAVSVRVLLSRLSVRMKVARSTAVRSSTIRAGTPAAASSIVILSTRTGFDTSITMREPPAMTNP